MTPIHRSAGLLLALQAVLAGCAGPSGGAGVVSVADSLQPQGGGPVAKEYNLTLPGPWATPRFFMDYSFDNVTRLDIVGTADRKCSGVLEGDKLQFRGLVCAFEIPAADAPTAWRLRIETAGSGSFRLHVTNGVVPDGFEGVPAA